MPYLNTVTLLLDVLWVGDEHWIPLKTLWQHAFVVLYSLFISWMQNVNRFLAIMIWHGSRMFQRPKRRTGGRRSQRGLFFFWLSHLANKLCFGMTVQMGYNCGDGLIRNSMLPVSISNQPLLFIHIQVKSCLLLSCLLFVQKNRNSGGTLKFLLCNPHMSDMTVGRRY